MIETISFSFLAKHSVFVGVSVEPLIGGLRAPIYLSAQSTTPVNQSGNTLFASARELMPSTCGSMEKTAPTMKLTKWVLYQRAPYLSVVPASIWSYVIKATNDTTRAAKTIESIEDEFGHAAGEVKALFEKHAGLTSR